MTERFESRLFDGLVNNFTVDELHTLCLRLGVNPDRLAQRSLDQMARELMGYMAPVSYTHLDVYKRQLLP